MPLTNRQKMAIHSAARQAGVNKEQRRIVQYNLGGFWSAADAHASHEGFVAAMAHFERIAGGNLRGNTAGYWGEQDRRKNPTDRLLWKVRQLAKPLHFTEQQLDQLVAGPHGTNGAYGRLADLPACWLRNIIEALKAIAKRKGAAR